MIAGVAIVVTLYLKKKSTLLGFFTYTVQTHYGTVQANYGIFLATE